MLMNLGSLVTLANQPANVYLVIMDNGIYESIGGHPAGADAEKAVLRRIGRQRLATLGSVARTIR